MADHHKFGSSENLISAAQSQPVYTPPLADGAMQLLKVAGDRPSARSSSQPDKKVRLSWLFSMMVGSPTIKALDPCRPDGN